ncbi:hypothetical protein C8J57DRAFT_1459623 [Mycena rebaudengoi]|nr:hypothetical protein C8J57DRAFT_1459623 [Mycena rebaudengoi]
MSPSQVCSWLRHSALHGETSKCSTYRLESQNRRSTWWSKWSAGELSGGQYGYTRHKVVLSAYVEYVDEVRAVRDGDHIEPAEPAEPVDEMQLAEPVAAMQLAEPPVPAQQNIAGPGQAPFVFGQGAAGAAAPQGMYQAFAPDLQQAVQQVVMQAADEYPDMGPQIYVLQDAPAPLGNPAPLAAPVAPQPAPPAPGAAAVQAAQGANAAMDVDGVDDGEDTLPPGFPRLMQLAVEAPTYRDANPHVKAPAIAGHQPTKYQPNEGEFPRAIIALYRYLENANPDLIKSILANPQDYVFLPVINGGPVAFGNLPDLKEQILDTVLDEASGNEIKVFSLGRQDTAYGRNANATGETRTTYAPPFAWAAKVSPAAKARLLTVSTYAKNEEVAFHVAPADPSLFPWVGGFWAVDDGADSEENRQILRAALAKAIIQKAAIRLVIDRASAPYDPRPLDTRILELVRSIDPRWNPLMKAWTVFMHPCTPDARSWDTIVDAVCGLQFTRELTTFKPLLDPKKINLGPRCVLCKLECHLIQGCPFIKSGMTWWGAKDQIKHTTTGALARGRGAQRGGRGRQTRGGYRGGRGGRGRGGN